MLCSYLKSWLWHWRTQQAVHHIIYVEFGAHKQDHFFGWGASTLIKFLTRQRWSQFLFHQLVATDDGVSAFLRLKFTKYLPSTYSVWALKTVCSGLSDIKSSLYPHNLRSWFSYLPFHRQKNRFKGVKWLSQGYPRWAGAPSGGLHPSPRHLAAHADAAFVLWLVRTIHWEASLVAPPITEQRSRTPKGTQSV